MEAAYVDPIWDAVTVQVDDSVSTTPGRDPAAELDDTALLDGRQLSGGRRFPSLQELITRESSSLSLSRRRGGSKRSTDGDRSKSTAARGLWGLHFVNTISKGDAGEEGWAAVEKRFPGLADDDGWLPRSRFGHCIGISEKRDKEYAVELFDALARRRGIVTWMISKSQLKEFWKQLTDQRFEARIQTFFDMVDKNGDGKFSKDEVQQMISLSASTNELSEIKERAAEYVAFIMEELDPDNLGYVELHTLEMILLQGPEQSSSMGTDKEKARWGRKVAYFVGDKWKRVWVVLLWLCVCAALFAWKFIQYKRRYVFHVMGYCVCVAKGGAEMTKINMALILLPVCRSTITWLRAHTKLGRLLPFNHNIDFHKVVAAGIVVGIGLHVVAHMTCDFPRLLHASDVAYAPLKQYFGEEKPPNYWWLVNGIEGWTGLAMVVLMVIAYTLAIGHTLVRPWIRRKRITPPKFVKTLTELKPFWYSHHLFVIVYALFIVHGYKLYLQHTWYEKTTWMYVAVPMVLYTCERLIRASRACYRNEFDILEVQSRSKVLPGDVLALYMTKPKGFDYTSGQYILIKCPQISQFEWHPFSLTSAPGDDYLSVHIRKAGNWTTQLLTKFSSTQTLEENGKPDQTPTKCKVKIDGPYGAPAQDYKDYDVVLLVGLGIGVTPFISILKDVVLNNNQSPEVVNIENGMSTSTTTSSINDKEGGACALKRAYLYWSARDPDNFKWFSEVMDHVAEHDRVDVHNHHGIEIHNHCTSVYEEGDARSALIAMIQSLHYAKKGVDFLSGSKVMTRFGRPSWPAVFDKLANGHDGQRVGVFYCGDSTVLAKELKHLAQEFSISTSTKFEFHKENF